MVFPLAVGLIGPTPMRAAVTAPPVGVVQIASPPTAGGIPAGVFKPVPFIVTKLVPVPAPYQCGPNGLIALGIARFCGSRGSVLNGTPVGLAATARLLPAV